MRSAAQSARTWGWATLLACTAVVTSARADPADPSATCGTPTNACKLDHDCCAGLVCAEEVCVDASVTRPLPASSAPPTPSPLHTVGVGLLVGGGLVAAAALVIPIFVCQNQTTVDAYGQSHSTSGCSQISDGVKIGWIAGGGVGLTLALLGGIIMTASAPAAPPPTVSMWDLAPWIDCDARPRGGGLGVRIRF